MCLATWNILTHSFSFCDRRIEVVWTEFADSFCSLDCAKTAIWKLQYFDGDTDLNWSKKFDSMVKAGEMTKEDRAQHRLLISSVQYIWSFLLKVFTLAVAIHWCIERVSKSCKQQIASKSKPRRRQYFDMTFAFLFPKTLNPQPWTPTTLTCQPKLKVPKP